MARHPSKLHEYQVMETIGTGSFGTCRKVSRKADGKVYVWKEVGYGGMGEKEKQLLVQEVNLLRELRHPHIVRYHDRIIDREHCTLYIIMEYCEGGDLRSVISKCKEDNSLVQESMVWKVLHQLLLALQECHKERDGVHKVLHRDLKPANVFLDGQGNVKLGDFGLARILHHNFSLAQTFIGTPYYMSPEVFSEQAYDEKSDVWSLGCLLHELCTLSPPFTAKDQQTLAAKVMKGKVGRLPCYYSTDLQVIIDSLLLTKPSHRPEIGSLLKKVESLTLTVKQSKNEAVRPIVGSRGLSKEQLKVWESELQAKEHQLLRREEELSRLEKEIRKREIELRKNDRALAIRETVLIEKERRFKDNRRVGDCEHEKLREVQAHRKENIRFNLQHHKK